MKIQSAGVTNPEREALYQLTSTRAEPMIIAYRTHDGLEGTGAFLPSTTIADLTEAGIVFLEVV